MARLIDANAFIKECDSYIVNPPFAHPATPWHRGLTLAAETALRMPTVDAVEVVHGRWIVEVDGNFRNVKCSACGKDYACHTGMLQLQNFNYCPNCGAKMDGDGNG